MQAMVQALCHQKTPWFHWVFFGAGASAGIFCRVNARRAVGICAGAVW
jgi:hypothetical protein